MSARQLGDQVVHEYLEDPAVLSSALQAGHEMVEMLTSAAEDMLRDMETRGWA